jgi:transglutaminase-like putative cysteine protease
VSAAGSQTDSQSLALSISRYFEVSLYLLVLTGFVTLASTGGLDIPSTLFVAGALLVRGYVLATRRTLLIPVTWTTALTLAYVGFYVLDYLLLSQEFVTTTVHLVLFLAVVRLFSARRDRDNYFLVIIAFLMVLAAAVLTVESTFFFAFTLFLLFAIVTFILMEMKRTGAHAAAIARDTIGSNNQRLALSLAGITPAILFLVLIAGTGIFFILPRLSSGYLSAFSRSGSLSTGFSDHVELGSIGEIQQSGSVVMHIEISGDQRGGFSQKWRGMTLSMFDGTSWSNPYRPFPIRPGFNQLFDLRPRSPYFVPPLAVSSQIHYHVLMEPVGVNVFFLAPDAVALRGKYRTIAADRGGAVFNLDADHPIGVYDGWSLRDTERMPTPAGQDTVERLGDYLQLPTLDSRIPQLAGQIADGTTSDYNEAVAVENYLRKNFSYTLQLPTTHHADPLAYFLFERKKGHCEYFASAMAVMLRTLKIPSRVVTGFKTNEFNDVTSQYVVRASDAHAWVEAYFSDRGWVAFDPTPPSNAYARGSWSRLSMYTDALASFWREWVVNYDVPHQYSLGQQTLQNGQRWLRRSQRWSRTYYYNLLARVRGLAHTISLAPGRWFVGIFTVILALALLSNLRTLAGAFLRLRLSRRPDKLPQVAASLWYEKMLRKIEKKGLRKSGSQTPVEFAGSIRDERLKQNVFEFTYRYEAARFGNSAEDALKLPELYKEVVGALS